MNPEIIGFIAGFLTTACFFPQTVKALRSNDTKSIPLVMYIMFTTGICLWFAYGILIGKWPIIIFNAITIPMAVTILAKKIRNVVKKID